MDLRAAAAIALVSAAFLFVGLGSYGVVNGDEGIYHGIAERMVETGDLFSLDFRGERRVYDTFMNAPLHYWARAGLIAAFGSSLFTMRALSALFGVLTVVATYALGCRLAGRRAGWLAAAVQLTTFQFVYLHGARTGELDTIASFLVALACLLFLRAVEEERSFWPHHLALLALLWTKLPLTALPVLAELAWLALHPGARRHLPRYVLAGLAALPLALLWHGSQAILERDHVGRVFGAMLGQASGSGVTDAPDLGFWGNARYYAAILLYGAFPWSAAYPFAALAALRPAARARRTALLWAAVALLFFCAVSKHFPWYVLPAYPFLSVLVGAWLADLARGLAEGPGRGAGWGIGAVVAAMLWIGVDPLGTNPFAERALVIPMDWQAHHWLGFAPATAVVVLGGAFAVAWRFGGEGIPDRLRRALRRGFVAAILLLAALRAAGPLAYLDHQSPLDRIHAEVLRKQQAGERLRYPIRLGQAPPQIARFLFGEDFEIVVRPTPTGSELALRRKGDPRALDRSIGRLGLEHRFRKAREARERAEAGPR